MLKTIETLVERAQRLGEAKSYHYEDWYGNRLPERETVYHVINDGNDWKLYHYGTLTATYIDGEINVIYGESKSDVSSIETFIHAVSGKGCDLHFYPSKELFTASWLDSNGSDKYIEFQLLTII